MGRVDTAYPPQLADYVVAHWPATSPLRLSRNDLCEALAIAFQTSLTREETRPLRFRVLLTPSDALPATGEPNEGGVLRVKLARPRAFTVEELRRIAPAAPFETALIGVHEMAIWGLAHSGPAWLAPAWGGRSVVPIWSRDPIVHVTGPGQLAVRSGGKLVGGLDRGALIDTTMDVFDSKWLRGMFSRQREQIRAEYATRQKPTVPPTLVESSLIGRVSQHMLRRCIQIIRSAHHGGMLLIADPSDVAVAGVRVKYQLVDEEPSRRYRTLLANILDLVRSLTTKPSIEWADFAASDSPALANLEQAVFEWSRLVAQLAAVDGAVLLDKRFALVGFGAEVSSELPIPPRVCRALDAEGDRREARDIEDVGTRHRAAYRFVHGHPDGLCIVVSQDGNVTFVAQHDDDVAFWEQSVSY